MLETTVDAVIDSCVKQLFTNGAGQEADLIVLITDDGRYLGGWCRQSVRQIVADAIKAAEKARK